MRADIGKTIKLKSYTRLKMASQRLGRDVTGMVPLTRRGISTRSQNQTVFDQNQDPLHTKDKFFKGLTAAGLQNISNIGNNNNKRKADASPGKQKQTKVKRSALGNLTNAVVSVDVDRHLSHLKKVVAAIGRSSRNQNISKTTTAQNENAQTLCKTDSTDSKSSYTSEEGEAAEAILCPPPVLPKPRATKILTRAATRTSKTMGSQSNLEQIVQKKMNDSSKVGTIVKPRDSLEIHQKTQTRRISNEFEKTDDSLYVSALEDMSTSSVEIKSKLNSPDLTTAGTTATTNLNSTKVVKIEEDDESKKVTVEKTIDYKCPATVTDFDKENWDDPFQVSHFAMDIFNYLRDRETLFPIRDYMTGQSSISRWMRSLLIDWMVEVQESFELNHETLYLAVKIVDLYLSKELISKDSLQLLGAAALFISSKFDVIFCFY